MPMATGSAMEPTLGVGLTQGIEAHGLLGSQEVATWSKNQKHVCIKERSENATRMQ